MFRNISNQPIASSLNIEITTLYMDVKTNRDGRPIAQAGNQLTRKVLYINNISEISSCATVSINIYKYLSSDQIDTIEYNNNSLYKDSWNKSIAFSYDLLFLVKLICIIRKVKPYIVFFTDTYSRPFNILSVLYGKNIKLYGVFHDHFYLNKESTSPLFCKVKTTITENALLKCDKLFFTNQNSYQYLKRMGVVEKNLVLINLGIDKNIFNVNGKKPKLFDYQYILSIGTEIPRKNMEYIMKAFALIKSRYPHIKLIKIGHVNFRRDRKLTLRYIAENSLIAGEDVIIHDFVDESKLKQYYGQAEFVLFPSLAEGYGLPVIEAQACGTPVITSNRSPMCELVPYKDLLVEPTDEVDIFNKCDKVLSDGQYREYIIQKGLDFSEKFIWGRAAGIISDFMSSSAQVGCFPDKA